MEQRSPEWFAARVGSLGGSKVRDAFARLKKSGDRMQVAVDFMYELAAERLTQTPARRVNARDWGRDHEDEARASYAFLTNLDVVKVALIPHPTIANAHASPDSLVGDEGGLEIKCPTSATHLKTLLDDAVPEEHLAQVHWNLACAGPTRRWWDFASYDPRFIDPELRLFVKRVERNDDEIARLEAEATAFLADVDSVLSSIHQGGRA
jgi:predicted phage-related endonuclease